jgi:diguanylate cyclase (GGDEF)-like protein/PAS domain S-box-containing protein
MNIEIKLNEKFFEQILNNLYEAVYFCDVNKKIIYWNKAAEKLTGYTTDEVLNNNCFNNIMVHTNYKGQQLCNGEKCLIARAIKEKKLIEEEVFLKHKDGYKLPVIVRISPIVDVSGKTVGAVQIFSDNSAKLAAFQKIEKLEALAFIDSLTGIGNRRYTEIKIFVKLEEIKKIGMIKNHGVLFIDIDHFKKINDTFGHKFGDDVLKIVAKTILKNIREDDFIGRWGGEEFVAIISNVDVDELRFIAEKIRALIYSIDFKINDNKIKLSVAIGATLINYKDDITSLIQRADALMYQCKKSGRNCVTVG